MRRFVYDRKRTVKRRLVLLIRKKSFVTTRKFIILVGYLNPVPTGAGFNSLATVSMLGLQIGSF